MNILLVDDEIYTIRTLQSAVHWQDCGVEHVWSALNVAKARAILEEKAVELILCDIEMPGETGLDLLEWIRNQGMDAEMILLTCHTDFSYAQRAISLGAIDYCVKPIIVAEIEKVIKKSVQKIEEKKYMKKALKVRDLWEKNRGIVDTSFWKRTLEGKNGQSLSEVMRLAADRNIDMDLNDTFAMALFSAKFASTDIETRHGDICGTEGGLSDGRNCNSPLDLFYEAQTYFGEKNGKVIVIEDQNSMLCTILFQNMSDELSSALCREYLTHMQQNMAVRVVGCYCADIFLEELISSYQRLHEAETSMTAYTVDLQDIRGKHKQSVLEAALPKSLELLVYRGQFDELEKQLDHYLSRIGWKHPVSVQALHMLRADICQALDVFLKGRNISAHTLFSDEELCRRMNDSTLSVEHMVQFIHSLKENIPANKETDNITSAVKKYISFNLSGEITREGIAQALHMNEDYISRVFKRDMGLSIPQYINQARICQAKHLLSSSDMPVSQVAESVGYTNFSYFSKVFRQSEGCTPREYKMKMNPSFLC